MQSYSKAQKYGRKKNYAFQLLLAILLCGLLITASWFTYISSIVGNLTKPSINPQLIINGSEYKEDLFIIDSVSNLSIPLAFKFNNTNVENIVARVNVSIEVGTLVNGKFVNANLGNVSGLVSVNYTSDWIRGRVPSEEALDNMGIDAGITCFTYHYCSNLLTSDSTVTIATGITDSTNLMGEGYVFKVYMSCETAVAGDIIFGEIVGENYSGGLWTEQNAQGTAPTTWIESIKNQI